MEKAFTILHVVAAVFLVGPMAILPMVAMRDLRAGNGAQAAKLGNSTNVFSLASLIVIVFGFGLIGVSDHDLSITTPWILATLIVYVLALALTLAVVVPALRGAGEATDRGSTYKRVAMSSGIATLLLLAAVVLMVWKP